MSRSVSSSFYKYRTSLLLLDRPTENLALVHSIISPRILCPIQKFNLLVKYFPQLLQIFPSPSVVFYLWFPFRIKSPASKVGEGFCENPSCS
uniref:Uncharacterized protein n=1 Tax=Salix viminalis TaxID=40686 RepID=A0A6N2KQJ6_SALVM